MPIILVINPGSTSTKLALYDKSEVLWEDTIEHSTEKLDEFNKIIDQLEWRQELILDAVKSAGYTLADLEAVVARGGAALDSITGGTYEIDEEMISDLYEGKNAEHASNLAGIIAHNLTEDRDILALTVDPISVDEFKPVARLSGLPELPRRCQSHALNLKAIGRKAAAELDAKMREINLVGVHLGGGISIAPLEKGKIVDVNNANQGGPYSPERVGTLPSLDLMKYIYNSGLSEKEMKKKLIGKGGLVAYLGTNDGREVEKKIDEGDKKAKLVYDGMIYQIAKEIGAMAAVLSGDVQGIFITGGLARSSYVTKSITERVNFIAPVMVYPGAEEMKHLAEGAIRVLEGQENSKKYAEERIELGDFNL